MNRWWAVFVVVLVAGGAWLYASQVPADAQPAGRPAEPAAGHPAPDFTLATLDGAEFKLSELRGTPVVLNFWATWCGPCQRELPAMQAAAERYDGLVVIAGVDQGEDADTVQAYVDKLQLTFPIPMDTEQDVGQRYNIKGLPTTFFIDGEGIIRRVWAGEMNSITLAENIAQILP
jgi:peroxiredoxin